MHQMSVQSQHLRVHEKASLESSIAPRVDFVLLELCIICFNPSGLHGNYKPSQQVRSLKTCQLHRVSSWSSLTGSPRKGKSAKGLTILADTEAPVQAGSAASPVERELSAPKRLGSVRFAADHLQPDSPSGSSLTGICSDLAYSPVCHAQAH